MSIRAIAIDMDGTLLSSSGTVSERNLAALRSALEFIEGAEHIGNVADLVRGAAA